MTTIKIVDARERHRLEFLTAPAYRPEDVMEWESGLGKPIRASIEEALFSEDTVHLRAILLDDRVVAIFGVTMNEVGDDRVGMVWLVGIDIPPPPQFYTLFLATWRREVDLLHLFGGDKLLAGADDRNLSHHRWLKAMGFDVIEQSITDFSMDGSPFTIFGRKV